MTPNDSASLILPSPAEDVSELHAWLRESDERFRNVVESLAEALIITDLDDRILYANCRAAELTGRAVEELRGRIAHIVLFPERDHPRGREEFRKRAAGIAGRYEIDYRYGEIHRLLEVRAVPQRDAAGEIVGTLALMEDIGERRAAEEENLRLAALTRENPNPVLECDPDGEVLHANRAAEAIPTALGLGGVRGVLPRNHQELVRGCLEREQAFDHIETPVADRIFSWTYRPDREARVVYVFAEDITGRRTMEEQLRHEALHDALTGLPNRLLLMERLSHSILRARRRPTYQYAVLFLDLDRFKVINDSLGHHVGDELLVRVAARLMACLRAEDTVARLGGDEFALLLEEIHGIEDATRVAERIHAELARPLELDGIDVFTSASIGIALSSTAYERPEYLLRNADMAMYRAKASGTGRFEVFDRAMHAEALTRLQLETDLRWAVERDELRLLYQPLIALRTGGLVGVEALIRWSHPERGTLSPDQFIPAAEETGLILGLGEWVLTEACGQARCWMDEFPDDEPLCVGVNLSAKQLSQPDLVERVAAALEAADLPASGLRLEITESAIMENAESATILLARLKALGVQISLDDFGTGYSSLSYLHRFPLDTLKIDRSFVTRMHDDVRSAQLVRTILDLARNLSVAAVAEGVETPEQLEQLRAEGCELGQGYYFSVPVEAEEVTRQLRARRA